MRAAPGAPLLLREARTRPRAAGLQSVASHRRTHSARAPRAFQERLQMAKIAKTADRKKVMDTSKSTDCPKCGQPTRIVKRVKDRERGHGGGIYISCSACEFFEKL